MLDATNNKEIAAELKSRGIVLISIEAVQAISHNLKLAQKFINHETKDPHEAFTAVNNSLQILGKALI